MITLYRKKSIVRNAKFVTVSTEIRSPESVDSYRVEPGDVIVWDIDQEREDGWRVRAASFHSKYAPEGPHKRGEDGKYIALPELVLAEELKAPVTVTLDDGSELKGELGDFRTHYPDESMGIVDKVEMEKSYEEVTPEEQPNDLEFKWFGQLTGRLFAWFLAWASSLRYISRRFIMSIGSLKTAHNESEINSSKPSLELFEDAYEASFAKTDAMAYRLSQIRRGAAFLIFGLAVVAVALALMSLIFPDKHLKKWFVVAELIALFSILSIYLFEKKNKINERWINFRDRAEWLRVAPLLMIPRSSSSKKSWLLGVLSSQLKVNPQPVDADQNKKVKVPSDQMRAINALIDSAISHDEFHKFACSLAEEQRDYHLSTSAHEGKFHKGIEFLITVTFALACASVMVQLFVSIGWAPEKWKYTLMFVAAVLPAFGASLHGWITEEDSSKIASRSSTTAEKLKDWLSRNTDPYPHNKECYDELAQILYSEVGEWSDLRKHQHLTTA